MKKNKKYISSELAKLGRELGFNESEHTLSELQTWLRDEHDIIVEITYEQADKTFWHNGYFLDSEDWTDFEYYQTYEEALEDGLKCGLNILKNIDSYEE